MTLGNQARAQSSEQPPLHVQQLPPLRYQMVTNGNKCSAESLNVEGYKMMICFRFLRGRPSHLLVDRFPMHIRTLNRSDYMSSDVELLANLLTLMAAVSYTTFSRQGLGRGRC